MSLLSVSGLSFRYSSTTELFRDASFAIENGDCLAIAGTNGTGKSTMLRVLAGELEPGSGSIAPRKGLRMASAGQQWTATEGTLFEVIFEARPELARLRARLAAAEHEAPLEYAALVNEYGEAAGYAAEAETERILEGLGFARGEWDVGVGKLSGGQRTRAGLARALLSECDLLLLDEPTNHLDVRAREWLEEQIAGRTCVLVSHDRALLRKVATRVLEIERGRVRMFEGGYEFYRSQRLLAERQEWEEYEGAERRKAAAEQASERRSRLAVQVAAPPSGERSGNDFYERKASKVARTARLLRERVERGPAVEKPWQEQPIPALRFDAVRRSGDIALSVSGLAKGYGERRLFEDVSFELRRGERLAITGPNGAGKTTLLRVLLGREPADAGRVQLGAHVVVGDYGQDAENLHKGSTPLEICGRGTAARTLLACLKVRADGWERPLATASGGECAKVALVRLLVSGANLLVLDEPTNHLDVESQEALESALAQFPGTMVVVSHDRSFLEELEVQKVVELG